MHALIEKGNEPIEEAPKRVSCLHCFICRGLASRFANTPHMEESLLRDPVYSPVLQKVDIFRSFHFIPLVELYYFKQQPSNYSTNTQNCQDIRYFSTLRLAGIVDQRRRWPTAFCSFASAMRVIQSPADVVA